MKLHKIVSALRRLTPDEQQVVAAKLRRIALDTSLCQPGSHVCEHCGEVLTASGARDHTARWCIAGLVRHLRKVTVQRDNLREQMFTSATFVLGLEGR